MRTAASSITVVSASLTVAQIAMRYRPFAAAEGEFT